MLSKSKFFSVVYLTIYLLAAGYAIEEKDEESTDFPREPEKEPSEEKEEEIKDAIEEEATLEKNLEDDLKELSTDIATALKNNEEDEPEAKSSEESPTNEKEKESEEETTIPSEEEQKSDESSDFKSTPSEEKLETTSAASMLDTETSIEKEEAPKDTFAVWSSKRKICLLAKFHAVFSIMYSSKGGEQKAEITVPKNGYSKGKCGSSTKSPLLQVSWQKYAFTMMFNKTEEDNWVVTSMELTYDTSEPLFDGATNAGKKTARSKSVLLFETPLQKSYYCPAQETVPMYTGNKQVVTARIKELQLQPYEVEAGQFSPVHRCSKVIIDGLEETPFVQDETVPLAVGCTLALITLFILVGFSIHRAYHAAKVDYNSME
ncbi:lysosome-associated membrane glycoprotein 5 [Nephila pilipes]|uniref:Lysosome-associated membrane glycoprotein 5 n=1 Tax=Nephila pilipes TaxID=299642 RepID=A0A8X6TWM0_NEPPI|nr:lysosome-associated membrane glycoprotein 5 [Nephila pilipes]